MITKKKNKTFKYTVTLISVMVILTNKENKIIKKKLSNKKLSQLERNRLSRSIRPKLREISLIDSKSILEKIDYNPKIISIENKIIKVIKNNIQQVDSIILYGSVIQNNYHEYNDIDIIIATKSKVYNREIDKSKKIKEIKNILEKDNIISDVAIISKENLIKSYNNSPTLIYELKDSKIIYGKIKIPNKIELYNIDLHMKLDWSKLPNIKPTGKEVYSALRNTILVRLLLNKIIDNSKLKESLYDELGKMLIERLKNNNQSDEELKYSINYLNKLTKNTRKEIKGGLWEKIELSR
jgi:predicted nucleotidyltransferase